VPRVPISARARGPICPLGTPAGKAARCALPQPRQRPECRRTSSTCALTGGTSNTWWRTGSSASTCTGAPQSQTSTGLQSTMLSTCDASKGKRQLAQKWPGKNDVLPAQSNAAAWRQRSRTRAHPIYGQTAADSPSRLRLSQKMTQKAPAFPRLAPLPGPLNQGAAGQFCRLVCAVRPLLVSGVGECSKNNSISVAGCFQACF